MKTKLRLTSICYALAGFAVYGHDGHPQAEPPAATAAVSVEAASAAASYPIMASGEANRGIPTAAQLHMAKEVQDEAMSGRTLAGTPVTKRTDQCFPAEQRDILWQMDQAVMRNPVTGEEKLQPLDFDENGDGVIDNAERDAIRGRNTWVLWGGGNDVFWNWLQQHGYGLTDFLVLLDSRKRDSRFRRGGLINQPGFLSQKDPKKTILGLYIDQAGPDALFKPKYGQPNDPTVEVRDVQDRLLPRPVGIPKPPPGHPTDLFVPYDRGEFQKVIDQLPKDGLDYSVYGYPSGIVGLRLVPNPDYFANTPEAEKARKYWDDKVVKNSHASYYDDRKVTADPRLVRPFRVNMSCGFCHVAPHPLNPPPDVENPGWEHLSSIIGGQYWDTQPTLGNRLSGKNFLYHFLKSQAPGTVDTSLVSTDQINNTNVINAVFDVPSRLDRAFTREPEWQSPANLLMPSIEEGDSSVNPRHMPMVLFPGEDSIGTFGALARVPLNIGVFSEQWAQCDNPLIGFVPQKPFSIAACRANSVYWRVNEKYRVGYMAKFFTLGMFGRRDPAKTWDSKILEKPAPGQVFWRPLDKTADGYVARATQGMWLRHAPGAEDTGKGPDWQKGRRVFLENCAICHSSKQPEGFRIDFQRDIEGGWANAPAPTDTTYKVPATFASWEFFRGSPAFAHYREKIKDVAKDAESAQQDDFLKNNYLSSELRVPITLVGTYSGRSMATNATAGSVWDNYSSDTFKNLKSVGNIRFYNPFSSIPKDEYGNNDEYNDGRIKGGPGYMRPPSLISVWATAPYFHNNTLGIFNWDPSVKGRLEAFEDGIEKLLNNSARPSYKRDAKGQVLFPHPGDLRFTHDASSAGDPGYIYRIPEEAWFEFAPGYIKPLIVGVAGPVIFSVLELWLWVGLTVLFAVLYLFGRPRHAGLLLLAGAVVIALFLGLTGLGGSGGTVTGVLVMSMMNLLDDASEWYWLAVLLLTVAGFWLLLTTKRLRALTHVIFGISLLAVVFTGIVAHRYLNGNLKDRSPIFALLPNSLVSGEIKGVKIGPIPKGTPVNLLMNIDPEKKDKLPAALIGMLRATVKMRTNPPGEDDYAILAREAGPALLAASKCPDMVLDRGHWFGEHLTPEEKAALKVFLKSL